MIWPSLYHAMLALRDSDYQHHLDLAVINGASGQGQGSPCSPCLLYGKQEKINSFNVTGLY